MRKDTRDIERIEDHLLHTAFPEEGNYNYANSGGFREKFAPKIQKRPKHYLLMGISGVLMTGIIVLLILIARTLTGSAPPSAASEGNGLEGFDYLVELDKKESDIPQTGAGGKDQANYFVNPTIKAATGADSCIQIGERAYKLPVALRELEQDGIILITLGVQPPDEEAVLNPQMRTGYLQFEGKRLGVTLKNGIECTYHDLTVCEISADEEGSPVYVMGGLTIGSEEAAIPQTADRIEQDAFGATTFYQWGEVVDSVYSMTGRRLLLAVYNGKIEKISVFNDGTAD